MSEKLVPFSSDTETQPTPGMREAIASAVVGDEQQGNDPTVNELQARVADLLGKEAALWFPGGTMCNFVATKVHTNPADAVVADYMAHIIRAESAGVALSSGVLIEPIVTQHGTFTADELAAALDRLTTVPVPYGQPCGMVAVEQTHNLSGGSVWDLEQLKSVTDLSREKGIPTHMDGARLMNACAASNVSPKAYAETVDSVWIDFTKGLGAPIGAVMAGSRSFIEQARRMKHVFGGAMRQAGIAAAGCLYALEHHVDRLAEDHTNARTLAKGLSGIEGVNLINGVPETNMVFFDVAGLGLSNRQYIELMRQHGIKLGAVGKGIRAVTHLDITHADVVQLIDATQSV